MSEIAVILVAAGDGSRRASMAAYRAAEEQAGADLRAWFQQPV